MPWPYEEDKDNGDGLDRDSQFKGATVERDIGRIIVPCQAITERVNEIGAEVTERFRGRDPLIVAIMNGCVVFLADLLRQIPIPVDLEFIYCQSYCGLEPGDLKISYRPTLSETVRGRNILLVDDIFDTGTTITGVHKHLLRLEAADVFTAVLLMKRGRALPGTISPNLVGFEIDNLFAVGYGLDYNGKYRNLPFIGMLRTHLVQPVQ